jgi:P-loop Nucleotide Kinase3
LTAQLLYLIGAPGAGKSACMQHLTAHLQRRAVKGPPAHDELWSAEGVIGAELGARRAQFSGTDALPMDAMRYVAAWLTQQRYPLLLGEGARLANMRFFNVALTAGYKVTVAHLQAPPAVLEARRQARGSAQNPTWIKGATTRAANLANQVSAHPSLHLATVMTDVYAASEVGATLRKLIDWEQHANSGDTDTHTHSTG